MTEIKPVVQPDIIADDIGGKSVAFVCIQGLFNQTWPIKLAIPFNVIVTGKSADLLEINSERDSMFVIINKWLKIIYDYC